MSMESFLDKMAGQPSVALNIPRYVNIKGETVAAHQLPIVVGDDSYRYRAIMGDHTLNLKFALPGYYEIPLGTTCRFQGQTYTLERPENIKKNGTADFEYDLVFDSPQSRLQNYMIRNTIPGDTRLKFSYTARPWEFLKLLVDNMNGEGRERGWDYGRRMVESAEKTVSFNHNTCAEALQMIAEAFETEWEVVGTTIYLRKVEYDKEDPLPLSYGKGNGFLPGLGRSEYTENRAVQRLFVQGGDRNIDASKYRKSDATGQMGSRELLLPVEYDAQGRPQGVRIRFDGTRFDDEPGFKAKGSDVREYVTSVDGASVCRAGNEGKDGLVEGSLDCTGIYPMREGNVTGVEAIDAPQDDDPDNKFYDFFDSGIIDDLDYSKDGVRIPGETVTVIFQSGMLAGKEFEIEQTEKELDGYVHSERRFKLKQETMDGVRMPGGVFIPSKETQNPDGTVGDKYAVFNVMPDILIPDAERRMLKEAVRYLYDNEMPRFTFTGTMDGIWAKREWDDIRDRLKLGGYIRFSDTQFLPDGMDIRITGIKDYVNDPYKPEMELSNNSMSGSPFTNALHKIESGEVTAEHGDREVMRYAKRRFRDARETMGMLQKSLLDFTDGISPITVHTMQLLVGDESLQFEYISSSGITDPKALFRFDPSSGMAVAPAGTLTHRTLGINYLSSDGYNDKYKKWSMKAFGEIPEDPAKAYYLYAKCNKGVSLSGGKEPGAGGGLSGGIGGDLVVGGDKETIITLSGEFVLSENAVEMEDTAHPDHYHFLVGIFNSEYEGDRSFAPMYGYTEILPGRITTDEIVCADGKSYLNLADNKLRMTNESETNSFDWNGSQLSLKGSIDVSGEATLSGWKFTNDLFCSQVQQNGYMEMNPEGSLLFKRASDNQKVGSIIHSGAGGMTIKSQAYNVGSSTEAASAQLSPGHLNLKDMYGNSQFRISDAGSAMKMELTTKDSTQGFSVARDSTGAIVMILKGGLMPLNVIMEGLPTSKPIYAASGTIWRDGEALKIVP